MTSTDNETNDYLYRGDFEISCIFRNDMGPGFLMLNENRKYINIEVESMYQGYIMGRKYKTWKPT